MTVNIFMIEPTIDLTTTYSRLFLASLELESIPQGMYEIDGIQYMSVGIPKIIIESDHLKKIEILVQKV